MIHSFLPTLRYLGAGEKLPYGHLQVTFYGRSVLNMDDDGSENSSKKLNSDEV